MSSIVHLARALWGAGFTADKEFGMLSCYFDEAGGEQDNFTVICGWVSTVPLWEQFEIDWKLFLASYKVPYLHMKEFSQSNGPFEKWKDQSKYKTIRRQFIQDAHGVIRDRARHWVMVFVDHRIFKIVDRQYKLTETLSSPYAVAGRSCVAQVELWNKKRINPSSGIEYVFEDGGPDKKGLLGAMDVSYVLPSPIFKPGRTIKDKVGNLRQAVVQLQAADLLAYELRKHKREFLLRSNRIPRGSLVGLLKIEGIVMASFNQYNAVKLCQLEKALELR
jgi:hypothetical protein